MGTKRARPKLGRPPLGDEGRTVVKSVKFSVEEIAAIERAAEKAGTTVSAWIRDHAIEPLGLMRPVTDDQ